MGPRARRVGTSLLVLAATLLARPGLAEPAREAVEKLADTPDLMQTHEAAGLPGGGAAYCGPVAVSNSLVWLAKHGYPRLAPLDRPGPAGQGALAALLGGPAYMKTSQEEGTGARAMAEGLSRYLVDHGVPAHLVRFRGCDPVPEAYSEGVGPPDLGWVKRSLDGHGAVWLKIGWYHHDRVTDTYRIFAGHWVTLVGYGQDEAGRPDPAVLIIHDPAPRSGPTLSHDYVRVSPLASGSVVAHGRVAAHATRGYHRLGGGLRIKRGADAGILDGALVLTFPGGR